MTVAMSCWEILGLEPGADSRSIKRHYAQRLKHNRPDDDPQGFQRLREAYEQAMDASRLAPLAPLAVEPNVTRASRRAPQWLEGMTLAGLENAWVEARNSGDATAFEDQLLERCLEATPQAEAFTDWALEQFDWLTPWQRPDLARDALQPLLNALLARTQRSLAEQLRAGNDAHFCQHVYVLSLASWMQSLERREHFNLMLATVLLNSDYWSCEVFNTVCKLQGWKDDGTLEQRRTQPYWSALQERHLAQVFLEDQQRLARQAHQTPSSRAARLLLTPMSDEQRRQFTRYFLKDDWTACERLSETLHHQYPRLYGQVPSAMPTLWRALKERFGPGLISYVQLDNMKSIGLVLVISLAMLVPAIYFNGQLVGRNQGLQAFPERLCRGRSNPLERCHLPETKAQWYPNTQAVAR
ncbi:MULTISPECIES: J domain-containing protein [unclassified Pseudomonas]|uniref:J domain-containing protein n=1 Tax=unclassified Pseudomonas TaxID=196821 RepID=UPI002AC9062B|nr:MULTISPECIES: J domain-containing protein [unclassified Pseudomonas]MEB0045247.1 J domain-containing protein [Pseudomonas sp. Dout3]MEB0096397.1 J domain-containing protein [Pseudomonas sp. DC1.2]WPX61354.1 J domain-containing protein [Pseudomonas sp. DC1.2]